MTVIRPLFLVPLVLLASCTQAPPARVPVAVANPDFHILFGTQTTGPTRGFYESTFDSKTGALSDPVFIQVAAAPSYYAITPDERHLYSVNAIANFDGGTHMGAISSFSLDAKTGGVSLLNQRPSEGDGPCYISLDHTGHFAFVSNYRGNAVAGEGGTIAVYAIMPDGSLGARTAFDQHKGTSVDPTRQTQAYAHSIVADPTNHFVISCDLGLDKVFVYKFNDQTGALTPNDPAFVAVKPGSGPRHPAFHPNGKILYTLHEMGGMITAFHWDSDKGVLTPFQEISTLPPGFTGTSTAAEIRVTPDGKFVYASNRGDDSIAEFAVDSVTFQLRNIGIVSSAGKTPRGFDWDPTAHWMVVTNQAGDSAVVFQRNAVTGLLTQVGAPIPVTAPTCPRFVAIPK